MPKTYKRKKYHYLYKTTNLVNGRYYFGMHSTNDLEDGYLGSGTLLRRAIVKYGERNFKHEILTFCKSREELAEKEHELVEQYLGKQECMNLKPGGKGGFCNAEHARRFHAAGGRAARKACSSKQAEKLKTDPEYNAWWHKRCREANARAFLGRKHTDLSKQKMSKSHKGAGKGCYNSQYGTCWITNSLENKKIPKGSDIPEGWRLGRVLKRK